ncbi:MAG: DUF4173 domain-containing protein [Candidatus Delongbacteria bacterium]|nr:DUF4173 domain-containing protein [Candidatus Delongbacteria bacterium]
MKKNTPLWIVWIGAILFTILFHNKTTGINLIIFNAFVVGCLIMFKGFNKQNMHHIVLLSGVIITLLTGFFFHSPLAITMNYISLILFSAAFLFPQIRGVHTLTGISFLNIGFSIAEFFSRTFNIKTYKSKAMKKMATWLTITIIPLAIIIVFIVLYSNANPWFNTLVTNTFEAINTMLITIFGEIHWSFIWTLTLGLFFVIWLLLGKAHSGVVKAESTKSDELKRKKSKFRYRGKMTGLKTEYRSAMILLVAMNVILLIVNFLDIKNVWFGFEWQGDYLKQFVHEGTWLLIISILLSIGIILFYFRKNLNFASFSKPLKVLAYAWMTQNFILALSVAVRNLHYISYFNLAYKRIAVFFFLMAVVVGLITVIIKIRKPGTAFFLLRTNSLAVYIILVGMCLVNWDVFIAKYNFRHADTAFLHLNFMQNLDNRALPWLIRDSSELASIKQTQYKTFDFARDDIYMTPEAYQARIKWKRDEFISTWEEKHWLSWNPAEHRAYQLLTGK